MFKKHNTIVNLPSCHMYKRLSRTLSLSRFGVPAVLTQNVRRIHLTVDLEEFHYRCCNSLTNSMVRQRIMTLVQL